MKAQIIEKGDGWVTMRYEAESTTEAIMIANVKMNHTDKSGLSMHSTPSYTEGGPPTASVIFSSISVPVIDLTAR